MPPSVLLPECHLPRAGGQGEGLLGPGSHPGCLRGAEHSSRPVGAAGGPRPARRQGACPAGLVLVPHRHGHRLLLLRERGPASVQPALPHLRPLPGPAPPLRLPGVPGAAGQPPGRPLPGHGHPASGDEHPLHLCVLDAPEGRLVRLAALEGEPVADGPRVPLPHGAVLPHVVGVPAALGRPARQPAPAAPGALPERPVPADARAQPLLDPQEDAAAPPPGRLELRAAAAWERRAPQDQRPRAPEEGAVAARQGAHGRPPSRRATARGGRVCPAVGPRDGGPTRCFVGVGFPGVTGCLWGPAVPSEQQPTVLTPSVLGAHPRPPGPGRSPGRAQALR